MSKEKRDRNLTPEFTPIDIESRKLIIQLINSPNCAHVKSFLKGSYQSIILNPEEFPRISSLLIPALKRTLDELRGEGTSPDISVLDILSIAHELINEGKKAN